jgi:hypothetical protein
MLLRIAFDCGCAVWGRSISARATPRALREADGNGADGERAKHAHLRRHLKLVARGREPVATRKQAL